jgi:hypothetical protein
MKPSTAARWLASIGIVFLAGACSGGAQPNAASSSSPPDTGRHSLQVIGAGTYPGYTVIAPDGWSDQRGYFLVKDPGSPTHVVGLSVWDVARVYKHPCRWMGQDVDSGPSVDDLVAALAVQPLRNASRPINVTLAGYSGRYLEWSVPTDMRSTNGIDFDDCDVDPSDGHRYFESWVGNGMGDRNEQVPGQVSRLWVLNVGGQRLLVQATYSPDTSQADRQELGRIAESIRFKPR